MARLLQGDCLRVASIEDGTVDAVFADPPFNLGKDDDHGIRMRSKIPSIWTGAQHG